jgi:hypothetical protein
MHTFTILSSYQSSIRFDSDYLLIDFDKCFIALSKMMSPNHFSCISELLHYMEWLEISWCGVEIEIEVEVANVNSNPIQSNQIQSNSIIESN